MSSMTRYARGMRTRTLAAWISTAMLVGLIVVSYGLDWRAALWGDFNAPPAPPAHTQLHWQVVETYPTTQP